MPITDQPSVKNQWGLLKQHLDELNVLYYDQSRATAQRQLSRSRSQRSEHQTSLTSVTGDDATKARDSDDSGTR